VDNAVPKAYRRDEASWSVSNLEVAMDGVSAAGKAALEEGVVALWHLKMVEEGGGECKMWQDQVEAWLVRYPLALTSGAG